MSRKRAHAQVLAEWIIKEHELDLIIDDIETWPDLNLYGFCEYFGYSWEGVQGWVDLEDL